MYLPPPSPGLQVCTTMPGFPSECLYFKLRMPACSASLLTCWTIFKKALLSYVGVLTNWSGFFGRSISYFPTYCVSSTHVIQRSPGSLTDTVLIKELIGEKGLWSQSVISAPLSTIRLSSRAPLKGRWLSKPVGKSTRQGMTACTLSWYSAGSCTTR